MGYEVEPEVFSARRSRRRRALVTLAVVALTLFFAFWYAYSYYQHSAQSHASAPTTSCPTTSSALAAASVTVNVYNATSRNGLAARTAALVRTRGFLVATVSNDPLQKKVTGAAEVRYGKSGAAGAKLVLALVRGARGVLDARADSSVDLVLGDRFTALAPPVKTPPVRTPTVRAPAPSPTTAKAVTAKPTTRAPATKTPATKATTTTAPC